MASGLGLIESKETLKWSKGEGSGNTSARFTIREIGQPFSKKQD